MPPTLTTAVRPKLISNSTCHRSFIHIVPVRDCLHIACQGNRIAVQWNRFSADIECHRIANTCFDRKCNRLRISDYGNNRILDIGFDEFAEESLCHRRDHRHRDYPIPLREQLAVLPTDSQYRLLPQQRRDLGSNASRMSQMYFAKLSACCSASC